MFTKRTIYKLKVCEGTHRENEVTQSTKWKDLFPLGPEGQGQYGYWNKENKATLKDLSGQRMQPKVTPHACYYKNKDLILSIPSSDLM